MTPSKKLNTNLFVFTKVLLQAFLSMGLALPIWAITAYLNMSPGYSRITEAKILVGGSVVFLLIFSAFRMGNKKDPLYKKHWLIVFLMLIACIVSMVLLTLYS
ncbi:MAG TPA: hypothetical protein VD905_03340 [Flavobacteriales bacterium]|nr:hypothetical protein [Flavobacteriales bacterium]